MNLNKFNINEINISRIILSRRFWWQLIFALLEKKYVVKLRKNSYKKNLFFHVNSIITENVFSSLSVRPDLMRTL